MTVAFRVLALVLGLLVVEIGARVFYVASSGDMGMTELRRSRNLLPQSIAPPGAARAPGASEGLLPEMGPNRVVIHPYLGYIAAPSKAPEGRGLSPEGVATHGAPVARAPSPDRIVVGLFGGSAAWHLARDSDVFLRKLREAPQFRGKEVRLVTAAIPSYKQPQQLNSYAYLSLSGYHFDVVVNIDGLNELIYGFDNYRNGINPIYPRYWDLFFLGTGDVEKLSLQGEIRLYNDVRTRLASRMNHALLDASAIANLFWYLLDRPLAMRISELGTVQQGRMRARSLPVDARSPRSHDPTSLLETVVQIWSDSSTQMQVIAKAKGARYLHFLEPGARNASPRLLQGYQRMLERRSELERNGVEFVDLGNTLLPERIALEIAQRFAVPAKEPQR